jgi:hypothetical protein
VPDLVQDTEQNQHQTGPNKNDCLLTIVSDYGHVVLDAWIAIEELMSPPEDAESYGGEAEDGERDCNPQRWNASLLDRSYHQSTICCHGEKLMPHPS